MAPGGKPAPTSRGHRFRRPEGEHGTSVRAHHRSRHPAVVLLQRPWPGLLPHGQRDLRPRRVAAVIGCHLCRAHLCRRPPDRRPHRHRRLRRPGLGGPALPPRAAGGLRRRCRRRLGAGCLSHRHLPGFGGRHPPGSGHRRGPGARSGLHAFSGPVGPVARPLRAPPRPHRARRGAGGRHPLRPRVGPARRRRRGGAERRCLCGGTAASCSGLLSREGLGDGG